MPLVSPDTLQLRLPVVAQVLPSGEEVTTSLVIVPPPLSTGLFGAWGGGRGANHKM